MVPVDPEALFKLPVIVLPILSASSFSVEVLSILLKLPYDDENAPDERLISVPPSITEP